MTTLVRGIRDLDSRSVAFAVLKKIREMMRPLDHVSLVVGLEIVLSLGKLRVQKHPEVRKTGMYAFANERNGDTRIVKWAVARAHNFVAVARAGVNYSRKASKIRVAEIKYLRK